MSMNISSPLSKPSVGGCAEVICSCFPSLKVPVSRLQPGAEDAGGVLVKLHWRRQAKPVETGPMASRAMDLQVAKDILDFKSPIY
jgi:hypothetical protein